MLRGLSLCIGCSLLCFGDAFGTDVLLYVPFDRDALAAVARGKPEPTTQGKLVLRDGLVGRAALLGKAGGAFVFEGQGNIDTARGSAAFWVKPLDWDSKGNEPHNFLYIRGEGRSLAYLYKLPVPDTMNFFVRPWGHMPRGDSSMMPSRYERRGKTVFEPSVWKHIVLTWFDDQARIYLDGALRRHWPMPNGFDAGTLGKAVGLGASWDPKATLMDEVYVFHHPLSPAEVAELHRAGRERRKPRLGKAVPFRVYLKHFPEAGLVEAFGDAAESPNPAAAERVVFHLRATGGNNVLAKAEANNFTKALARTFIALPKLPAGSYVVAAEFSDAQGRSLGTGRSSPLEIKHYPWMDEKVGVSDEVIEPWTPIQVEGTRVDCWGRRHWFAQTGLPDQIESSGSGILAAPVRLALKVKGQERRWELPRKVEVLKQTPGAVVLRGGGVGPNLRLTAECRIEFDGLLSFKLELLPTKPCEVEELRLEIPFAAKHAVLLHYAGDAIRRTCYAGLTPAGQGMVWTSASIKPWHQGIKGSFVPYVWLGDDERGLAWFADTTRYWNPGPRGETELYRQGQRVTLVVNFIAAATRFTQKRVYEFGLMATPVKPLPQGWRNARSPVLEPYTVKHITHSCTFQGYGKPTDEQRFREVVESHRRTWPGCCVSPAMGANDLWGGEESAYFINDWNTRVRKGMATPVRNDFQLWHFRRVVRDYGIDGAYSDDSYPIAITNPVGTSAWVDAKGAVHEGYNLAAIRGFHRRIATVLRTCKGHGDSMVHMSDAMVIPCFSFFDLALDGEFSFEGAARTSRLPFDNKKASEYDFLDVWRMDAVRTRMGRQWGLIPVWLPTGSPEDCWGYGSDRRRVSRSLLAMVLIHDTLLCWNHKIDQDEAAIVDEVKKGFGIGAADVDFHGYWEKRATASSSDVLVSYWQRPGKVLLVAANLARRDLQVDVRLDLKAMGLGEEVTAIDGVSREGIECSSGSMRVTVPWHEYRLVLIAPKGKIASGRPHPGAELPKPKSILSALCDDFDAAELSPAWTVDCAPNSLSAVHPQDGKLKLRNKIFMWCHVERPLGIDNISVQCRIEDHISGNFDTWRPCMVLYWGKGNYARAMASCQWGAKCFKYLVMAGGEIAAEQQQGPQISQQGWYTKNWVKISLRLGAIDFYGSIDGKTWLGPWTVKRPAALSGPPKLLILGRGHETGGPPYDGLDFDNNWTRGTWGNPWCCYFDDLIVGRD